ncbi:COP1-interactive protein 1-like isoform X3 [Pomacea canaliculata]|uniref:COP1-interactive protein 1-like isoform X3 n=1 Tax=Pomacea canaliculata TaxID=400727 RepID=UPI000D7367FA|nr:COP1-interactive protein 1-like isoform X3 [Pomacea canaliculata]
MEEPTVCPVCVVFEPQAWRKSLCRNCFKTFEQHEGSLPTEESTQKDESPPTKAEDSKDSSQTSPDVTAATVPSIPAAPSPSSASKPNTPSTLSPESDKASVPKTTPLSSPPVTTVHPTTTTTTTSTATATKVSSLTSPTSSKASAPSLAKTKEGGASKLDESKKGTAGVRANGGSASAGKPGIDHKVTSISSVAGKIEQPKRSAGTSTPTAATSSSKQSPASDSKLKGVGDKKGLSSKSPSTKESVSSPTSPSSATPLSPPSSSSSSLHDNSVRSKWEKRVASAGGGGGGGAELGARFDVKKGQKATDAKVKSAESGDVASKSRSSDIGKKVGKETSQPEDSTVSAAATTAAGSSVTTGKITATEKIEQKQSTPSSKATASTASTNVSLTSKSKSSEHVPATASVTATVCSTTVSATAPVSSDTSCLKSSFSANKASATVSPSSAAVAKQDVATKSQITTKSASTTKVDGKELQQQNKKQECPVKASEEKKEKTVVKEQAEQKEDASHRELRTKVEQLEKELRQKEETLLKKLADKEERLLKELASKEKEVDTLKIRVVAMEAECGHLKNQVDEARKSSVKGQREELEKTLGELRQQVSAMEKQCSQLESDNQTLLHKLRDQAQQAADDDGSSTRKMSGLQGELLTSEMEVENLREENAELRHELLDLKREMEEMYDSFRENELDEFRELQRELDLTAKNCRVLQFKLRKAERRNDQVEHDRQHYEEKLRSLQQQFESGDARSHIEALEEELRTAKEVSVRLHDELDLIEERRNKALEENRHLTELLEQTDKKQFRMEMEIDKLRDQIADLRQQLRDRSPSRKEGTPDRKPDVLGRQGSQDYDSAQLMRDLCDSVERETDLKEQLKFIEEESRMLRKKLSEMEDENEALRVQLKKLSLKASRWKEESEGKGHSLAHNHVGDSDQDSSRERLDSSDDESSVVTLKLQVAMMEQELMTSHRAQAEAEKDSENLRTQITSLEQRVRDYEYEAAMRKEPAAPPTPDTYYEDRVRELTQVADELRWRIIEKDRELERLSATSAIHARHSGHHGHHGHHARDAGREIPREGRLKKSKSLDSDHAVETLLRQLDSAACDATTLRHQVTQARDERDRADETRKKLQERVRELEEQIERLASRPLLVTVPSVHADDAAVENIELKDKLRRAEDEVRSLRDQVRTLTDNLRTLSRSTSPRLGSNGAASPQVSPHPPVFPPSGVSDSQVTATDSLSSAAAPIAVAAPAVATATPASTFFAASASTVDSAGILHVPDDAHALHELLREADEERRVLASAMAELEQENARLRASLGSEPLGIRGVAVAETEDESQKKRTDKETRETVDVSRSHEALVDRELDMKEQHDDLLLLVRRQEETEAALTRELTSLRTELQNAKDHARRTELELLQDLDMLHDKNSVLSNLLDIVQERATAAEEELEKLMQENSAPSTRSASAVSAVSALSDASCGSDEVFLSPPSGTVGEKGQIIHRDWEAKLKNRIESLERLLAEERQKVSMAEKKVRMAYIETIAPSVSDDIKLRVREKELLQEELLENQRHLHIAADQIKGLRERLHAMEEEHHRLKLDKRDDLDSDQTAEDSDKTPENSVEPEDALVALRAASLLEQESPSLLAASNKENKQMAGLAGGKKQCVREDRGSQDRRSEVLERELAFYKLKAEQMEYKVQEISDIWRSKSAATEREKKVLEADLCDKTRQVAEMSQTISQLQQQIKLLEAEVEKARSCAELYAQVQRHHEEMKKEVEEVKAQTAEHHTEMRQLRESVSTRDERLKEKDDIIRYLNTCLEERQKEIQQQDARLAETSSRLAEQASSLAELQQDITLVPSVKEGGGETDLEKENTQLRETTRALRAELEQGEAARQEVDMARRSMAQMSLNWEKEKAALHVSLNIADEKLRLYENLTTTSVNETMECLKAIA